MINRTIRATRSLAKRQTDIVRGLGVPNRIGSLSTKRPNRAAWPLRISRATHADEHAVNMS